MKANCEICGNQFERHEGYDIPGACNDCWEVATMKYLEKTLLKQVRAMCEESLSPLSFAEFEKIEAELKQARGIQETP